MAEDTSTATPLETSPLAPLRLKSKLAPTPRRRPKYAVTILDARGAEIVLADPRATRALVAVMNVHAVPGGAARHWGGAQPCAS